MNESPPPRKPRSLRFAVTLNFIVPGTGQFYLGQRVFGGLLAAVFLACFAAMMVIFLRGYVQYLGLVSGGDVLAPGVLEQLVTVFHVRWLVGLLVASLVVFAVSMVGLAVASKRAETEKNG